MIDDEEEEMLRKKMERKLREKEDSYQKVILHITFIYLFKIKCIIFVLLTITNFKYIF